VNRQNPYFKQVLLLVRLLPIIGKSSCFALKGGTAINFFYRNMPRLSVDIDLVYLPVKERQESLNEITTEMSIISASIQKQIPGARIQYSIAVPGIFSTKCHIFRESGVIICFWVRE